jgi:hypothetical protein
MIHKSHLPTGSPWAVSASLLTTLILILILFLFVFVQHSG